MSTIRRQSIISSLVIYIGFAIGLFNVYLFTKQGIFQDPEYGLYNAFIAIATMMMAVSNLAMPSFIYKFFPYYKDNLPAKKNDQLSVALLVSLIGFAIVLAAGFIFKDLVIKKYSANAPELVAHYKWIFPLAFGFLIYTVLEAYTWQLKKSIVTNFLKEVAWRLFVTILIVLFYFGVIPSFDVFIKLFSFSYPFIALLLLVYLAYTGQLHLTLRISKVTKRMKGSIFKLCRFVFAGTVIFTLAQVFDSLVILSKLEKATTMLAVYSLAQNIASMIQVPQRGIVAASIPYLSQAWKDKDMGLIQRIYQRSSINQLIFAAFIFSLLILNFTDAVYTFQLKGTYLDAYYVIILLGLTKIVDMGTGLNAQIIATSTFWRFEMLSGIALLAFMLPLSYFFTISYGIVGTAAAQLISMCAYNAIRIIFLWKKFRLSPFTMQTAYSVLLAVACFFACYFIFINIHGIAGMFLRSIVFILLYATGTIYMKLSPDIQPVIVTIKKKLGFKKD
jgi:O-antigen/teichoic acid export membrane protein